MKSKNWLKTCDGCIDKDLRNEPKSESANFEKRPDICFLRCRGLARLIIFARFYFLFRDCSQGVSYQRVHAEVESCCGSKR